MKTKIIPFDLETAKKIQDGKIEGKIKTRGGYKARILCTDLLNSKYTIAAGVLRYNNDNELVFLYCPNGSYASDGIKHQDDLVLEVPDNEPQFKPFDKVLVRDNSDCYWVPRFIAYRDGEYWRDTNGCLYVQCIPYEGNEHLVGTTDKPKED